ncbi:hypothetical protein SAMN06265346_12336 [Flavobacterium hercynium]|nr:hypothetical protein SAMN06265346_12336 [Flavobacterium hercynium]
MVYWFLYPVVGILAFGIQLHYVPLAIGLSNFGFNLLFVSLILGISFLYLRLRKLAITAAIGLGDILFFAFITFTFSIVSFLVLFIFSLMFAVILHFVLSLKKEQQTVPLAGYMSLFFLVVYTITFFHNSSFLYAY